ncbi:MAG TPA: hypothetical protein P5250_03960 [Bacteroidales bacterium]|nr:hypothetical protein [Bacteroidales bacterium]
MKIFVDLLKNKIFILLSTLIITSFEINAQTGVAINTTGASADLSAMLDISSLNKGVLIPRLTEAQKNLIVNPATGLIIYQLDQDSGFYYNASISNTPIWVKLMPNPANSDLNMNYKKIINVATCTNNEDAANKAYVDNAVLAGGGTSSVITQISTNQCISGCDLVTCRAACISLGAGWHIPSFEEQSFLFSGALGIPVDGWINGYVWTTTPGWYGLVGSPSGVYQYNKFMVINEATGAISYNSPSTTYNCRCVK